LTKLIFVEGFFNFQNVAMSFWIFWRKINSSILFLPVTTRHL